MKSMNISILISWIKEQYAVYQKPSNTEHAFQNIRILEGSDQPFKENFLYLTDKADIMEHNWTKQDPVMSILCVKTGLERLSQNPVWYEHLIIIRTDDPILTVYNTLQDLFDRYKTWYGNCLDMILKDTELYKFLDYATIYLDNPIAFFDPAGILLHQTGTFHKNIDGTLWEEVIRSGYTPTEMITPSEQIRIMEKAHEGHKLIPNVFLQDPSHHALTIPLHVNGDLWGAFGMIDINAPFTDDQNAFLRDLWNLTELSLKRLALTSLFQDEENYYVARLLQGFPADNRATEHYLKEKNFKASDIWYLYLFSVGDSGYAQPRKAAYIDRISSVLPNAIILFFENSLVAICRKKDFDPEQETVHNKLHHIIKRLSMKVYISSHFTQFADLTIAYGQCKLMEKYLPDDQDIFHRFDDSFQSVLYGILLEKNSLKGFCHPDILSLWESQSEQKRILVHNLKYYLLLGRNIAETSRYLNLHRNTFIYRLQKIQECLHLSLDNLNENMLLYLLLSCMICENAKE